MNADFLDNDKKDEKWFLCLSDDDECPTGYAGYVFPDSGYYKCIEECRNRGEKNIVIIPDICSNDEDIVKTDENFSSIIQELIPSMTRELNVWHNSEYTDDSWFIMLGMWLQFYVPQLFDKYSRIKKALDLGYEYFCVAYQDSVNPTFDYSDYFCLICNSEYYNCYIYSEIIRFIDSDSITCKCKEIPSRELNRKKRLMKLEIIDMFFRLYHFLLHKKDRVVLHGTYLPPSFLIKLSVRNLGKITNYFTISNDHIKFGDCRIDYSWRNVRLSVPAHDCEGDKGFFGCLLSIVKKDLPIAYVEGFNQIIKESMKYYRFCFEAKAIVFSAMGVSSDEAFKYYLMNMKNNNSETYVVQHGGCYGIDKYEVDLCETRMTDYQYTWGWEEDYAFGTICKPMPATKLMDERANIKSDNEEGYVLYVANSWPRHMVMWHRDAFCVEEEMIKEADFFGRIDADTKKHFRIRLFPCNYGRNLIDDYAKRIPDISLDTESNFYKSVSNAKLCLFPVLSTTFLEALNQHKPCIAYRRGGYTMNNAHELIKALENTGVICNDWETFYYNVVEAVSDPDKWWNESERKQVVESFVNRYAFHPGNSEELWYKELMNIGR